jgi:hypothetical protein
MFTGEAAKALQHDSTQDESAPQRLAGDKESAKP